MYWGFLFLRSLEDATSEAQVLMPSIRYYLYGLLLLSLLVLLIRVIMIIVALRVKENIADAEKFKEESMQHLSSLNPYLNRQLLKEVVGKHSEAFSLLLAAGQEANDGKKKMLTQLAFIAMTKVKGGDDLLKGGP